MVIDPISASIAGVSTGLKIFGGFQKANAAAKQAQAQADAISDQYNHQLKIQDNKWYMDRMNYQYRINEYNRTAKEADRAKLPKLMVALICNKVKHFKSAAYQTVGQQIQLDVGMTGRAAASGKVGRSAQRLDADPMKAFSRSQAKLADSLLSGQIAAQNRAEDISDQALSYKRQAYTPVSVAPTAPLRPMKPKAPINPVGYGALDIATDVMSGVSQYNSLAPEGFGLNAQNSSFG